MDSKELAEQLEQYPKLKAHFVEMLRISKNEEGAIELADDAEDMIIKAGRQLTHDTLML